MSASSSQSSDPLLNIPPAESSLGRVGAAYYKDVLCAVKKVSNHTAVLTRKDHIELVNMRAITHDNLCMFVGVCFEPGYVCVLTKFCLRGSLQDILNNDDIKLDDNFKRSFLNDLIQGLDYLHKSPIRTHGRMRSSNCLVDSRWVVKLNGWGLSNIHQHRIYESDEEKYAGCKETPTNVLCEESKHRALLWTAPEFLNNPHSPPNGTQAGDIYSLAIITQEILYRCMPYETSFEQPKPAKDIIGRVKNNETPPFRPKLPEDGRVDQRYISIINDCWAQDENARPSASQIRSRFSLFNKGKINIMDNMLRMMEKYANNLEEVIGERTRQLVEEKKKADLLLYRMLPASVADSLKMGLAIHPELYKEATIYFSDIVSFTTLASESTPMEVVDFLNDLWTTFDDIINKYKVYKVETIGDAYLVASGVPQVYTRHAPEIADMSLDILAAVKVFKIRHRPDRQLRIRIGMHSGSVVAGVVGQTMPRYCLFGDTVNMASRMESHGEPLKIHISEPCYKCLLLSKINYEMALRGEIEIKGKGLRTTYWLEGKR